MQDRARSLQGARVLSLAILAGPALIAAVTPIVQGQMAGAAEIPMLDTVAAIASVAVIPLAFFVRRTVWSGAAGSEEPRRMAAFVQGTVLFMALLEGAMLLDLIVWWITGEPVPAAVVAALLWAIALVNFPRQGQLDAI